MNKQIFEIFDYNLEENIDTFEDVEQYFKNTKPIKRIYRNEFRKLKKSFNEILMKLKEIKEQILDYKEENDTCDIPYCDNKNCLDCPRCYKNICYNCIQHQIGVHTEIEDEEIVKEFWLKCPFCNLKFGIDDYVVKTIVKYTNVNEFDCNVCCSQSEGCYVYVKPCKAGCYQCVDATVYSALYSDSEDE